MGWKRNVYRLLGQLPWIGELFGGKGHHCPQSARNFFFQRIIGINRRVPWPVDFTSTVIHPERMRIGRNVCPGLSPGCYIQAINGIEIGDNTLIGPGVGLISANHDGDRLSGHAPSLSIRIGKNCWIGMNAVILPGVELGDDVIVGANAVVTRSFPSKVVIAGNQARIIRHLPEREGS